MKIAIVYSTWHGHTREVAEHIATLAQMDDLTPLLRDVRHARSVLDEADAAVIAGSVHFGRHHTALRRFITRNRTRLSEIPSAFVSISGAAASIEGRAKATAYMNDLLEATGWDPDQKIVIGGALVYSRYDPLTRMAMKFASRIAGRGTDTTRDYDYTDWFVLGEFANLFLETLERSRKVRAQAVPGS